MLRTVLGLRALPRARASPTRAAWRDVWTRFLSSETSHTTAGARQWQSPPGPLQLLRSFTRHCAKRPNNGTWGSTVGRMQQRGFRFSPWRRSTNGTGDKVPERLSLGARLRKLSKEYGWSAVGVYLGLSVLDFPFCFLLVRVVGTETIGKIEHFVISNVKAIVPESARQKWHGYCHAVKEAENQQLGNDNISDKVEMAGWGVKEAQERNEEEASLATQLALAYAIHKSFIFVRVPLTAAVTPKVVKVLRSWGWNIGKRSPR
ncbi:peptide alpha-N-acetyltransferase [Hirsutella rhossiliensis]|uniref:Peptide alpha-N-acetyltransferase n=1 Tax=Hirsutella rhossiliensis TaxID=111463 RepID=A0A9P8MQK1_9HYPO|nr:peptide alpha-N-acetyltransferase [Hirsutella rhossiliensis]KAH0958361.1 peptide alpha-N-acetyltransferase [Hirsutella rhossiliensis]